MKEKEEKKPLPIPENCPPVKYPLVKGYTSTDSSYVGITIAVALILAIIVYISTKNVFALLGIIIFPITVVCMILYRDAYAENMIDKMRILKEHRKAVKHYIYYYRDIYGWVDSSEIWRDEDDENN